MKADQQISPTANLRPVDFTLSYALPEAVLFSTLVTPCTLHTAVVFTLQAIRSCSSENGKAEMRRRTIQTESGGP